MLLQLVPTLWSSSLTFVNTQRVISTAPSVFPIRYRCGAHKYLRTCIYVYVHVMTSYDNMYINTPMATIASCIHLAMLQGAALVVYNSGRPFSDADFQALGEPGQSSKIQNPSATGRFGLGFNSVFHVGDQVCACMHTCQPYIHMHKHTCMAMHAYTRLKNCAHVKLLVAYTYTCTHM